jgi:hypothetical protein
VKSDDQASNYEPSYRATGSSYEYWPGTIMLVTDFIALDLARPEFSLTKMYQSRKWPVLTDYNQLHTGRAVGLDRRNALYLDGGMRVDWSIPRPTDKDLFDLIFELQREPRSTKK